MAYFQRCSGFSSTNTRPRGHPYPSASEEMSCLVDYTDKISNLLEDFRKIERFVQNVEKQGGGNLAEWRGQRNGCQEMIRFVLSNYGICI